LKFRGGEEYFKKGENSKGLSEVSPKTFVYKTRKKKKKKERKKERSF
jgi:hypothetical protein